MLVFKGFELPCCNGEGEWEGETYCVFVLLVLVIECIFEDCCCFFLCDGIWKCAVLVCHFCIFLKSESDCDGIFSD